MKLLCKQENLKKNYCENVILYFNTVILQCVVILLVYNTHCSALTLACSKHSDSEERPELAPLPYSSRLSPLSERLEQATLTQVIHRIR